MSLTLPMHLCTRILSFLLSSSCSFAFFYVCVLFLLFHVLCCVCLFLFFHVLCCVCLFLLFHVLCCVCLFLFFLILLFSCLVFVIGIYSFYYRSNLRSLHLLLFRYLSNFNNKFPIIHFWVIEINYYKNECPVRITQ